MRKIILTLVTAVVAYTLLLAAMWRSGFNTSVLYTAVVFGGTIVVLSAAIGAAVYRMARLVLHQRGRSYPAGILSAILALVLVWWFPEFRRWNQNSDAAPYIFVYFVFPLLPVAAIVAGLFGAGLGQIDDRRDVS